MKDGSAGFSNYSDMKQEQFNQILGVHLTIVKSLIEKGKAAPVYHYFDLNAGPGIVNGQEGSPLIFLRRASELRVKFNAFFFEVDKASAEELEKNVMNVLSEYPQSRGKYEIVVGDHTDTMPGIINRFAGQRGWCHGLVYSDSNGASFIPTEVINTLIRVKCFDPIDVLAYISGTSRKRCIGAGIERPRLSDDLCAIDKDHRWIRTPVGRWQWTFAILSNWQGFPGFKNIGLYPLKSKDGEHILRYLDHTAKELQEDV